MAQFPISDLLITGASTGTTGNNIILASAGTAGFDKTGYRSMFVQVTPTGTISAGAVTFEGSNDNTNWVTLTMYDKASAFANPLTTYTLATGVSRYFEGPVIPKFIRIRISTAITGGGTVQAFTTFTPTSFMPSVVNIAQTSAANLNCTISTNTAAGSLAKAEDAVHASGDTGVFMLGVRRDTPVTSASAAGDYTEISTDNLNRVWVNGNYAVSTDQGYTHYRNTALLAAPVAVKASAGNIFSINILNINTTPAFVKVYNLAVGSTTVGTSTPVKIIYCPPGDGTVVPGSYVSTPDDVALFYASTAITIAAVTGLADASTTAPATGIYVEIVYK